MTCNLSLERFSSRLINFQCARFIRHKDTANQKTSLIRLFAHPLTRTLVARSRLNCSTMAFNLLHLFPPILPPIHAMVANDEIPLIVNHLSLSTTTILLLLVSSPKQTNPIINTCMNTFSQPTIPHETIQQWSSSHR